MPQIPDYPAPTRALVDTDVVLMSVDGKTTATPMAAIVAHVAGQVGGGDDGSVGNGGATGEWQP